MSYTENAAEICCQHNKIKFCINNIAPQISDINCKYNGIQYRLLWDTDSNIDIDNQVGRFE